MTLLTILPLALAVAVAGCEARPGGEVATDTESTATQIRDSADIIIVENARPVVGSRLGWQISAEPVISIGTVEGGEDFTGGSHIFSIWDTEGHHGRTLNLANLAPGEDVPKCRDVLANGTILASVAPFLLSSPTGIPESGLRRSEVDFFLVDAEGLRRPSLGKHPGAAMFWHYEDDPNDSFLIMDPPFQPTVLWAEWGEQMIVSPTDVYELRAYRPDGSLARIVRRDNNVRSPTQADLGSYRAENRSPDPGRAYARNRNAAIDALPLPASFPAFSAIEVDLLGNLWVREYNLPGDEDRALWTVFDPEGVALGFVETPLGLVIYEIGEDYLLGKTIDELGVEYVQLWGLDRSG